MKKNQTNQQDNNRTTHAIAERCRRYAVRLVEGIGLLALAALGPRHLSAQSLPAVNLGATSFVDGGPPVDHGLFLNQYFQYYHANRLLDASGNPLPLPGPRLDVLTSLTQLIYLWERDLPFGARPALDVLIPVVHLNFGFDAPGPFPRDNGGGLGDILVGPALQFNPLMGDKGPLFVHRFEAQLIFPTGKYDRDRELNPGSNFFSFNPYWAGTLFLGPKTTVSLRAHYLWNDENSDPPFSLGAGRAQAGQAVHFNFATSYEVVPKILRLGLNGYYLKQISASEIDGFDIPGREQVLGLGPGMLVSFSQRSHLFVNFFSELETENRPQGHRLTVRYSHSF